ncbi:ExbD/TolR family protein [Cerasicoccus arenae]|uniref:Protein TolR n=1 Tax=Cerasicoccus arenae TaxID=424488 RepID=A0A8J3D9Q3_9BACT|nr:biopolymer transporter ExbD [Cerasicoccus arenae]MBK1856747.1 biopolymer transporter ExbD [Cerasicoccus arenae]GHB99244.1 protein TolR [Cerasicoccus arenae]
MKAHPPKMDDQDFDITPMIDVVFLLIVFFMVVAAEITQKIEVELPEADKSIVPEELGRRMEVSINEAGDVYVGMIPVDMSELGDRVRIGNSEIVGFKVFVRADSRVPHKFVNDVMKTCAENGVLDVIFATFQQK